MAKDRNPIITAEKMMQLALLLADEQQFDMQGYEMTDCYDSYLLEDLDGENGISNRFDLPHIGEARFTKETLSDPNGMFRQFMMIFYYDKAGHLHASPVIWGTQRRRKYIRDVVV